MKCQCGCGGDVVPHSPLGTWLRGHANRGQPKSAEHREKLRDALTGRPRDPAAVEKTRLALLGRQRDPVTVEKVRRANTGREGPTTAKATQRPYVTDLHWAAGFLEGEGSFQGAGSSRTQKVSANQVNREPVDRLLAMFGGSVRPVKVRPPAQKQWSWMVCGSRARGVMLTLYRLLSCRRQEQVRHALERLKCVA